MPLTELNKKGKIGLVKDQPLNLSLLQQNTKEYKEDNTVLSSGFLERAVKRMEEENALAKVTGTRPTRPGGNPLKCQGDPNNLRCFLERGGLASYSGRNSQCHQLYSRPQPQSLK